MTEIAINTNPKPECNHTQSTTPDVCSVCGQKIIPMPEEWKGDANTRKKNA